MAVDADVTELSDLTGTTVTNILAPRMVESLKETNLMAPLCMLLTFPGNSDTVKVPKIAGLTSAAVAESAATDVSQWSTTSASVTRGKHTCMVELTDEALVGGGVSLDMVSNELNKAVNEGVDIVTLALLDGFSASVGTTATPVEPIDILDATYRIDEAKVPGDRVCFLSPKNIFQIQSAIIASGASVYANPNTNTFMGAIEGQKRNLVGTLAGVPIWKSANVKVSSGDDVGGVFVPGLAIALAFPAAASDVFKLDIVKGDQGVTYGSRFVKISIFFGAAEVLDSAGVEILGVS